MQNFIEACRDKVHISKTKNLDSSCNHHKANKDERKKERKKNSIFNELSLGLILTYLRILEPCVILTSIHHIKLKSVVKSLSEKRAAKNLAIHSHKTLKGLWKQMQ